MNSLDHDRRGSALFPAFILVRERNGGPMWACDVGLGGMLLKSRRMRFPGTYMDLSFTLPGTTEVIRVGAHIMNLVHHENGTFTLAARYCRLTSKAQMALYRFLDQRRVMWAPEEDVPQIARQFGIELSPEQRPFEGLLQESYEALQSARPVPVRRPQLVAFV